MIWRRGEHRGRNLEEEEERDTGRGGAWRQGEKGIEVKEVEERRKRRNMIGGKGEERSERKRG